MTLLIFLGMWDLLMRAVSVRRSKQQGKQTEAKAEAEMKADSNPTIPLSQCLYVGDAAGRPAVKDQRLKDFADSDLKLALNVGIAFQTPEKFFLKSTQRIHCDVHPEVDKGVQRLCDVVSTCVRKIVLTLCILSYVVSYIHPVNSIVL
jgi:Polynucleotide kinase 3 phosphatase